MRKRRPSPPSAELQELNKSFPIITWDHIIKYERDVSLYIAGQGWLKRGAFTNVIAKTDSGKSVFTEQLSLNCCTGTPFLDRIEIPKPVRVTLWQAENDLDVLNFHMTSIAKHLSLDQALIAKNLRARHVFGLTGSRFAEKMQLEVDDFRPDVFVIDHYQSYMGGDINSVEDFHTWYDPIQQIIQAYGIACVVVTHTPKIKEGKNEPSYEGAYLSAGTAALANSVRVACDLRRTEEDRGRFKLNFGKNPRSTGLRDDRGGLIHQLFVEHSHTPDEPYWKVCDHQQEGIRVNPLDALCLYLQKNPDATKAQAVKESKLSKTSVYQYWNMARIKLGMSEQKEEKQV
jgi:hypothetical protein